MSRTKTARREVSNTIDLKGLTRAPSQIWGAVRIVPLLRERAPGDLRLALRAYGEDVTLVKIRGGLEEPGLFYGSFVPHAMVVSWEDDGSPVAGFGTRMQPRDGKVRDFGCARVRLAHRMARHEAPGQLRFLPLHLAMEGFLAFHFGGPSIMWSEYSRRATTYGLDSRCEWSAAARSLPGLDEALRVFEIHPQQVGILLYLGDEFASAFVTPHPEDYRRLHRSLLMDFFGMDLVTFGLHHPHLARWQARVADAKVTSIESLREAAADARREWLDFQALLPTKLVDREVDARIVHRMGPFTLQRFMTSLEPSEVNHLGEVILRGDGTVEYMKTYRLSAKQTRRAFLLQSLSACNWNIEATAASMATTKDDLVLRLEKAGFAYLLKDHVLKEARKRK